MKKALLVFTFLLVAICTLAADPSDVLSQADRQFASDTRANGLDGWMKWWAADGYPGSEPGARGAEALRKYYGGLFARKNLDFRWAPDRAQLFPSGDFGYTSGHASLAWTDDSGKRIERHTTYLTVWQKQKDGSWKVFSDYGTADPAPASQ
jgi:ketosteroid isomerase-like protein